MIRWTRHRTTVAQAPPRRPQQVKTPALGRVLAGDIFPGHCAWDNVPWDGYALCAQTCRRGGYLRLAGRIARARRRDGVAWADQRIFTPTPPPPPHRAPLRPGNDKVGPGACRV